MTNNPAGVNERSHEVPQGSGQLIMVVEDDDLVQPIVCELLENLGYRVLLATNAQEALALIDQTPDLSLILSDIGLPGTMNGVGLAREVLGRALKVVLTSGDVHTASDGGPVLAGVSLLEKPYRKRQLAQVIAAALGGA